MCIEGNFVGNDFCIEKVAFFEVLKELGNLIGLEI